MCLICNHIFNRLPEYIQCIPLGKGLFPNELEQRLKPLISPEKVTTLSSGLSQDL